ncbi:MAG: hypothetical protein GXO45_05110 [Aquificae bacterium]|nr:hypothetical protein [Aquificota bacterium]
MGKVERLLFWVAIGVLVISIIGMKIQISQLEAKVSQPAQVSPEGGEE